MQMATDMDLNTVQQHVCGTGLVTEPRQACMPGPAHMAPAVLAQQMGGAGLCSVGVSPHTLARTCNSHLAATWPGCCAYRGPVTRPLANSKCERGGTREAAAHGLLEVAPGPSMCTTSLHLLIVSKYARLAFAPLQMLSSHGQRSPMRPEHCSNAYHPLSHKSRPCCVLVARPA